MNDTFTVTNVTQMISIFSRLVSIQKTIKKTNFFDLITNYFNVLLKFLLILDSKRNIFKEVRVAHFASPSPKYFVPF